jgi:hypothetical protein
MLKRRQTAAFLLLLVVAATIYVASAIKVQGFRDDLDPTQSVSALLVRPEVLEIAAGEFKSLLADFLLLKASIYLGGRYSTPENCKQAVSTLFRQSATLDPYFFQTCYYVQGYLPWWKGVFTKQAIDILEIIRQHRHWDWQPGFYIAFNYFYFLKDNLTASRYLMELSESFDTRSTDFFGLLGARLSQKGGQTKTSIAFLKAMRDRTENEAAKEEIGRRIAALQGVLKLEKAIARFKATFFGHPPDTLEQLVEAGILKQLPENPCKPDKSFTYEDGNIEF